MSFEILRSSCVRLGEPPSQLGNYQKACETFRWEQAEQDLDGLPAGGLNIAHEALDRFVAQGLGEQLAMRFVARDWTRQDVSFAELAEISSRFANVLRGLGVGAGDRVFSLAGRIPELYVTLFGTLKAGAVYCPLFSAFDPEPVQSRLEIGGGRVLVTTRSLYQRKVLPIRHSLPRLKHVILTDASGSELPSGTQSFRDLLQAADSTWQIPPTDPESIALLHFTSGTTGKPKGVMHAHRTVVGHSVTGRYALDLRPGDIYWCTADPGSVKGISYGAIAPLVNGASAVIDREEFDAERWYRILQEEGVNVWYTTPAAIRRLMRQGNALATSYCFSGLRHIASVGEPLNREAVLWGRDIFGVPIHDTWWQTETGAITIANFRGTRIRPGSMGRPAPGIEAAIVRVSRPDDDGKPTIEEFLPPGREGELALKANWPSIFCGYLDDEPRYRRSFAGGWYLTGDMARRDADGWFWFVGRTDEVIKSAGRLISPFEVENALMEHPSVAEAGVIGLPDPVAGEIVKAFVTLEKGATGDDKLALQLISFTRRRLGAALAPRVIEFHDELPRTRSGKIMRRLLKARELGLAESDTSALESRR